MRSILRKGPANSARRPKLRCAAAVAALIAIAIGVSPAYATYSNFGPQSWSNGSTTARYRAHVGYHGIYTGSCGGGSFSIEVRADVIGNPDVSEGYTANTCGGPTKYVYGNVDSFGTAYRGHFMQSHTSWYGNLSDTYTG